MAAPRWTGLATFSSVLLRLALGISFVSAVADRFGLWGVYGQPNVSWGNCSMKCHPLMETFTMSRKELPRAGLVAAAIAGRITNRDGAKALEAGRS